MCCPGSSIAIVSTSQAEGDGFNPWGLHQDICYDGFEHFSSRRLYPIIKIPSSVDMENNRLRHKFLTFKQKVFGHSCFDKFL